MQLRASPVLVDVERGAVDSDEDKSLLGPMADKAGQHTDVFGCIDADLRLGPSLVRSSDALRDAFEKDQNVIDMCVATDVDSVDFACGVAADIAHHFRKCKEQISRMSFYAADKYMSKARKVGSVKHGGGPKSSKVGAAGPGTPAMASASANVGSFAMTPTR